MRLLRTPDERFASLPGYPFAAQYTEIDDGDGGRMRLHRVDEGPRSAAETVLLLHGEPSWSYLYRTMIPVITGAGHRAIAPDLPGFGRSDKPAERRDYTYARHVEWMRRHIEALDLGRITLVCQDWGGLIGLRVLAELPERFVRVVVANSGMPTGDQRATEAFFAWQRYSQETPRFHVGGIVKGGCLTELPDAVVAAYDAPFPDDSFTSGARQFPLLVPTSPDDPAAAANRAAWDVLRRWEKPLLCAFSDSDPITAGGDRVFLREVPGTRGLPHTTIAGAGHFLQEDRGPELAAVVVDLITATPGAG